MSERFGGRGHAPAALGLAAAAAALLAACNVFSPLASDGRDELSYRGLILKGSQAINDGDYEAAERWFADAKALDPRGSEAYLFHSKALAGLYRIDYDTLNREFNNHRSVDGAPPKEKGIPFVDSNTTLAGIDSIYYPVAQSVENLEHILRKAKDTLPIPGGWLLLPDGDTASDGRVSDGVARLDLGLLQTIKGMLGPLDLDGDNHITDDCGANFCPDRGDASALADCRASSPYKDKCREGPASEANRFENFKRLTKNIDIDNIDSKDVQAKQVSSNPNDINDFLDKMQGPIAASSHNLDSVTGSMDAHNESELSGELSDIVSNVGDLAGFLGYMRYNDRRDNDFDAQGGAASGPMIWHDYNKDNGILFDYDGNAAFEGYMDGPNAEGRNIGHPLHRYLDSNLYVRFSDPEWARRAAAADPSKNSRAALMIKHCVEVAGNLAVAGKVTEELIQRLRDHVCSTFTSFLKPDVRPPARSDWLGGPFGIDEEEFDDHDNDYDGIKDEDTRNEKDMDDDDDGLLDTSMIGTTPEFMVWRDAPGHGNACPDIDTAEAMPAPPFQRKFCIGSLEHRIHLAQRYGRAALTATYSRFPNTGESGNANCLLDAEKLPADYRAAAAQESGGEREFRQDVVMACQYKHIWIAGMPPRSEWTAGVLGVDEELPDGADNDGDGWIDEDVR